jgi:hypothetical protein
MPLLFTACGSVQIASTDAPSIVVAQDEERECGQGRILFPAGEYKAEVASAEGTYYKAPKRLRTLGVLIGSSEDGGILSPMPQAIRRRHGLVIPRMRSMKARALCLGPSAERTEDLAVQAAHSIHGKEVGGGAWNGCKISQIVRTLSRRGVFVARGFIKTIIRPHEQPNHHVVHRLCRPPGRGVAAMKEGWLDGWKMRLSELTASPAHSIQCPGSGSTSWISLTTLAWRRKRPCCGWTPRWKPGWSGNFQDRHRRPEQGHGTGAGMECRATTVCLSAPPAVPACGNFCSAFMSTAHRAQPEMTHMAVALRPRASGLMHEALLVMGQRLREFTPEALVKIGGRAVFQQLRPLPQPHFMKLSNAQRSMALECPKCRRKYAVIAADSSRQISAM